MHRSVIVWVFFVLMMIVAFNLFNAPTGIEKIDFSDFMAQLDKGEITEVTIKKPENVVTGTLKNGKRFKSTILDYPDFVKELREKNGLTRPNNLT